MSKNNAPVAQSASPRHPGRLPPYPAAITVDDDGATGQSSVTLAITTSRYSDSVTFQRRNPPDEHRRVNPVTTHALDAAAVNTTMDATAPDWR